ncbi:MAG: hypothetical protein J2P31_05480, partial [Blastocatellia bacterium]|nr:hypothetical protein [Blastocatellia bacterium]
MTIIDKKKSAITTIVTLSFAIPLITLFMGYHSASAKSNSLNLSSPSAVGLSAQILGVPIFALGAGNNRLYSLSGFVFNRVGTISPV